MAVARSALARPHCARRTRAHGCSDTNPPPSRSPSDANTRTRGWNQPSPTGEPRYSAQGTGGSIESDRRRDQLATTRNRFTRRQPTPDIRHPTGSDPQSETARTPRKLRPEPPPSRGSASKPPCDCSDPQGLGTSPVPGCGSGDRLPPFGLGAPPEGARSEPAFEAVADSVGYHRITSMTICNVRDPSTSMQAQVVLSFRVSASFFAGGRGAGCRRRVVEP